MSNQRRAIAAIGFLLCLFLSSGLIFGAAPPAQASIHAYPDTADRVMYRSLRSLRDRNDLSWQLVFFDWIDRGQIESIHLRIVGFPGLELARSPLELSARTGQRWQATDVSATALKTGELPPNAGEFDLADVIRELQEDTTIDLAFALASGDRIELTVPIAIVREWRKTIETSLDV
ncbi:MAG: DUF3122 domain-containing protein [Geitlerinemataceae cyanobacterium]